MAKPVQLVTHCFPFFRIKTSIKDVEDHKLWRQEVEMPFPLLQGSDSARHLLSYLPELVNLLKEGDRRTAMYLYSLTSRNTSTMLGLAWGRIWHIASTEGNARRQTAPWLISPSSPLH